MRLCLIATGILLMSVNAQANTQLVDQLSVCATKSNNAERLSCYDQLAANVESVAMPQAAPTQVEVTEIAQAPVVTLPVVTKTTPASPITTTKVTPELKVEDFGLQKKVVEDEVSKLYFTVAKVSKTASGAIVITLDNGQVWQQTNAERYKVKKGQVVYIETGALNSFLMGSDERNATTRVKRLK
ncbi:hypothetical protein [Shewanella litoralis]|uniref:Uncharacterized protein n=1 Tax=Shewanella litoralis TaxID=2282700 RepID=A0ABQ2RGG7_9GAMM|nr:hypothetical protein [Shewanella litoralis]GGQ30971.1 hypothetical protein GCM10009411_33230 [Shewanella litoralis]